MSDAPELRGGEAGQASVEAVAMVPFVLLVGAIGWQLAFAGHTLWQCAIAARVAARAEVVGEDPEAAARSALSDELERELRVEPLEEGGVRVEVRMPLLTYARSLPLPVSASASLGASP